jgi:SpoVK/Ycf46/Vps4 family AAA+-type ATPase
MFDRPQEIDEAARRRFVKRLYVPLPDRLARRQIVNKLMSKQKHCLSESDLCTISDETEGKKATILPINIQHLARFPC